jgi:mRNA-degrading endonuclease RelE of RelBE toxin-antitoxin system
MPLTVKFTFIQLAVFFKSASKLLSDEDVRLLENFLLENPKAGRVIEGTGGLRKMRWAKMGLGKRGGVRVVYFWAERRLTLYFFDLYDKTEKLDLSASDKKRLAAILKELE